MDYILKNGYIVSNNCIKDIYIKEGKIINIEENIIQYPTGVQVIDLERRLVIDGFVDGHMHLDKALINEKVINNSGTLNEAIDIMRDYKAKMTKKDITERANKLLSLAFNNGTRYIRTHIDVDDKIKLNSLEALLEIKEKWKNQVDLQLVAFPQEGIVENKRSVFYLEEALKMGVDVIGGIPAREKDSIKHINIIFDLAKKYNVDIDMHIDETDDPQSLSIMDLCNITIANGYIGRVTAGHCCSLAANDIDIIEPIVDLIKKAKINIISLPSTNLYLQGRGDSKNIRRGIAPIKHLVQRGVPVAIASDNVRDPFNPFGNAKLLEVALIAAHGCHMGGQDDLDMLFDMITDIPRKILGFNTNVMVGNKPNFIVLDSVSKFNSIISQSNIYGYFNNNGRFLIN